jgi:hypothetical protein
MAASPETLEELRRKLTESRKHLTDTRAGLNAAVDVPARLRESVKTRVAAHPILWAAVALAGGVAAVRLLPLVVGVVRTAGSRRLLGTALSTLGPLALRAGMNALATHRPDLASFLHPHPAPSDRPPDQPDHGEPGIRG